MSLPAGKTHMPTDTRLNLTPQFVIGVFLILFGALLTLDRMQVLDAANSLRYWPVVLIALGGWIVIERGGTGRSLPGYAMIVIGALLFLERARLRARQVLGAVLADDHRAGRRAPDHAEAGAQTRAREHRVRCLLAWAGLVPAPASGGDGTVSMFAVLGSDQRASGDKPFRGGEVTSIMGGTRLDLRQAIIEPGAQADINMFVMMGGHEVVGPTGMDGGDRSDADSRRRRG